MRRHRWTKEREAAIEQVRRDREALPPPSGDAPTPTPRQEPDALFQGRWPESSSTTNTSATEVMEPDSLTTPIEPQPSITPAAFIGSPGASSMVWTESPLSVLERGWPAFESLTTEGLPGPVAARLKEIAWGMGEPIGSVIQQICQFFVEAEDERAEEPMRNAVIWYVENMIL